MKKHIDTGIDIEIDELTLITSSDLKTVTKKNGWQFDWKIELKQPERDVYKLNIVNNQTMCLCIFLRTLHSTKGNQRSILEYREI